MTTSLGVILERSDRISRFYPLRRSFSEASRSPSAPSRMTHRVTPYLVFVIIWILFSYPLFFQWRIPAPLDFLVNFFAPWDKYYDSPVKNPAISDVVNQVIPWKTFTAWSLKRGEIPLWNSYNLAGAPHLANWQSGVLYPTNLLFLFLPFITAWSLHVLLQPLLAGLFTILFLRSLSLSFWASLLGGLAFAYGGFMTTWLEWGTLGHAMLWLPLAFYAIETIARKQKTENRKQWGMLLISFSLAMSLFAGHLQISLYVIATTIVYFYFRIRNSLSFSTFSLTTIYLLLTTLVIASPQLLPSVHLYQHSYRSSSIDEDWFKNFRIPIYGLATFIAPDFFGNPVTRNHWSDHSYVEMMGYVGITPFLFALIAILKRSDLGVRQGQTLRTLRNVRNFFIGVILVSLALSLKTPFANILIWLKIPVLNSSSPARIIGLATFSLAVLSAIGFDEFFKNFKREGFKTLRFSLIAAAVVLFGLWGWTLQSNNPNAEISQRNLILPTMIVGLIAGWVGVFRWLKARGLRPEVLRPRGYRLQSYKLVACCLLLVAAFDLFRFHHKFTPFTDRQFFYPEIPVISWLGDHSGRTFGLFDANLNLPFRIATVEGYDPFVIGDYVRYTSIAETGETVLPKRTSSVQLPKNGAKTMEILNNLGVRYIIQPTVHGAQPWELQLWNYPRQFEKAYGDDQYEVYKNLFAKESIEPYANLHNEQLRLFRIGMVLSFVAMGTIGVIIMRKPVW